VRECPAVLEGWPAGCSAGCLEGIMGEVGLAAVEVGMAAEHWGVWKAVERAAAVGTASEETEAVVLGPEEAASAEAKAAATAGATALAADARAVVVRAAGKARAAAAGPPASPRPSAMSRSCPSRPVLPRPQWNGAACPAPIGRGSTPIAAGGGWLQWPPSRCPRSRDSCCAAGPEAAETEVGLASRVEGLVASEAVEGCAAAMVARAVGAEETAETAVAMAAGLEAATVELSPGPACRADAQATVAWAVAEGLGGA